MKRARTGGLTSQITEQINAKLLKTVETNPFYRMNLRQITEKNSSQITEKLNYLITFAEVNTLIYEWLQT